MPIQCETHRIMYQTNMYTMSIQMFTTLNLQQSGLQDFNMHAGQQRLILLQLIPVNSTPLHSRVGTHLDLRGCSLTENRHQNQHQDQGQDKHFQDAEVNMSRH